MQAAISGIARKALIVDGESLKVFDVNEPTKLIDCRPSDVPYVFGEGRDVRFIESADFESIAKELRSDSNLTLALDLTLISVDFELEADIRQDAILDLDELIASDELRRRLEGIMYARPLPDESDLETVLEACGRLYAPNASEFFSSLNQRQSLISNVSAAWDVIPTKVFGSDDQKTEFQRVAVQRGLFRTLVTFLENGTNVSQFLLTAGLDATITQLRNSREVVKQWAASFRGSGETPTIAPEVEEELREHASPRRRHGRRVGLDRQAVLREVIKRKAVISEILRRRDVNQVRLLVNDLVTYQLENGENEHAAKSLCDLALEAKNLGMLSFRLELTKRSIVVAPDDFWSWSQYGDALLDLHRLDDALVAYEQSKNFGAGVLARTGTGEVLKAQGSFEEALSAFEEVIDEHPDNVIAKTGRAEVLKAQGRFFEALAAFDEVIRQHPDNVVAKTGRAEVLKAQGRFSEALAAFDEVIEQHPDDVVAKTGRAEVLKAQGRFTEALAAFDEVISQHPDEVFAKNGRAEVLKAQGRFSEALAAFDEVIRQHPDNVVAKTGRAEVLKAQGRFTEALAAFDEVIEQHPDDVVAKTGRAEVLKAQGRFTEALAAFDEVISQHPDEVFAKNGRAEVLKAQGRFSEALAAFDEVIEQHPDDVVAKNGRAEVLKAQGRFSEALAAFDEVIEQHPDNVVAKNGRAEVLKAQGRFTEALTAFDEVIRQHPDNVVAKTGRAEVLKAQGRFTEALAAFDEVIRQHPDNVVAKNGRAEVLKAQSRFTEALAAFDEVIRQHPDNVFAKNGRAEVLKAQSRFTEALAAFDEVIRQHPDEVVAKTGRAEVLKAQGRFTEALAAFDEVIRQHPDEVFAKTGRAEVLKSQGQLIESLAAYNEIRTHYANNDVARNGRSCVLAALGRYEEALESLPFKDPIGLEDWIGFYLRGMVFLRMKRIEEAVDIFQRGVTGNPFPASAAYFKTALTVALIRQEDYDEASRALSGINASNLQPQLDVLRLHLSGEKELFEEANEAYEDLTPKPWSIPQELLDELHRRYILKVPPRQSNDWVVDHYETSLLLVSTQQASISSYAY